MNAKETSPLPDTTDLRSYLIELNTRRKKRKAEVGRHPRGRLSSANRATILAKTRRQCHICGDAIVGNKWTADHVFSHSGGGSSEVDNYLAAHGACNSLRWDYSGEERQQIAILGMLARREVVKGTDIGMALATLYACSTRCVPVEKTGGFGRSCARAEKA